MTAEVCAKQCRVVGPGVHEATTNVPNANGRTDGYPEAELKQFHTRCIGGSTASAVQLRFVNEPALATEVTETLPQALKRDPGTDGSYARLKGVPHPPPIHQM